MLRFRGEVETEYERFINRVSRVSKRDAEACLLETEAFLALGTLDDDRILSVLNKRVAYCAIVPANNRYSIFAAACGDRLVLMGGETSARREDQLGGLKFGRSAAASILGETANHEYLEFASPEEFKEWRMKVNWIKPSA